jgi:hypothetical protein
LIQKQKNVGKWITEPSTKNKFGDVDLIGEGLWFGNGNESKLSERGSVKKNGRMMKWEEKWRNAEENDVKENDKNETRRL